MGGQMTKPEIDQDAEPQTHPVAEPSEHLHSLYTPTTNELDPVDIVAVHGLYGDSIGSWTHTSSAGATTMWLQELLPQKLPNAHVMTFQYDATVDDMSADGVRANAGQLIRQLRDKREDDGYSGRPIVFIGHSLGGIIIKQALRLARDIPALSDICHSTKGIVFFGTPHRGTNAIEWLFRPPGGAAAAPQRANPALVNTLKPLSPALLKISEDFVPLASRYAIVSYAEQHADPILGKQVVQRMSAVMGLPNEDHAVIGGTHITMCQFGKGDPRFENVWRSIRRAARGPARY